MRFINREEAGSLLAESLEKIPLDKDNTIILAIPRGGVPVAYQISKRLKIPFSLIVTKKLAPISDPEAAFGAISTDGTFLLDKELMRYMGVHDSQLEKIKEKALSEAINKEKKYVQKKVNVKYKTVIIVDDGMATDIQLWWLESM